MGDGARRPDLGRVLRRGLAAASAGAGVIHVAAAFDHSEHGALLTFFVAVAVLQVAWAAAVLLRAWWPLLAAGTVLNAGVIAVWALSRTVGLPVAGAGRPEPVGLQDGIASGLELVVVAGVVSLIPAAGRRLRLASTPLVSWLAVAVVATLTGAGLAAPNHHAGTDDAGADHAHSGRAVAGDDHGSGTSHGHGADATHGAEELAGASHPGAGHAHAGDVDAAHGSPGHGHSPVPVGADHGGHEGHGVAHDNGAPVAAAGPHGHDDGATHDHGPATASAPGHDASAGHDQGAAGHDHGDGAAAGQEHGDEAGPGAGGHDQGQEGGHGQGGGSGHDEGEGGGHDQEGGGHDHCSTDSGDHPVVKQAKEAAEGLGLGCVRR